MTDNINNDKSKEAFLEWFYNSVKGELLSDEEDFIPPEIAQDYNQKSTDLKETKGMSEKNGSL